MTKRLIIRSHDEAKSADAAVRAVARLYSLGRLAACDAIASLREIGACEPEIAEIVR